MNLKVGDKVIAIKDCESMTGLRLFSKGDEFSVLEIINESDFVLYSDYKKFAEIFQCHYFEKIPNDKIKMVIGEDRVVECGEYKVEWNWGDTYLNENDMSRVTIRDKNGVIITLGFTKLNYKQQMEIANMILDKLGLNVELVEEDNSKVLEQIGKLEAELEKLRGTIK